MSAVQNPVPVLTALQASQLGVEATWGTAVPQTIRLGSMSITPRPRISTAKFTARGYRLPTAIALSEKMAEHAIEGFATYTELGYILKTLASTGSASVEAYTLAAGGKTWPGAVVNSVSLKGDKESVQLSGSMLSKWFNATPPTTGLTAPAQSVIEQSEVTIEVGTTLGTDITRWFRWGLDISDIVGFARFGGQLEPGAVTNPESCQIRFSLEMEKNATNEAFLANLTDTLLWKIEAIKGLESCVITGQGRLSEITDFKDEDGIYGYGLVIDTMDNAGAGIDVTIS